MTPAEKTEFKKELAEEFVLIPKKKLYYILGGAVAVVLVATGLSLASVFAYLRSEPAEIARKRIDAIRNESQTALNAITANLQKSGDPESRFRALEQLAAAKHENNYTSSAKELGWRWMSEWDEDGTPPKTQMAPPNHYVAGIQMHFHVTSKDETVPTRINLICMPFDK